jgi:hypothetical protein
MKSTIEIEIEIRDAHIRALKAELATTLSRVAGLELLLGTVREKSARDEGERIRRELLEEFGDPGTVEWRHLMMALDRTIPGHKPPANPPTKGLDNVLRRRL